MKNLRSSEIEYPDSMKCKNQNLVEKGSLITLGKNLAKAVVRKLS